MTDIPPNPPPQAPPPYTPSIGEPLSDERQMAMIVYILYLAAFAMPPLAIAGLVLAYVNRETAPDFLKTHYTFQIHTFWIALLYWVISLVLCIVIIGIFGFFAIMIWWIVRCALGLDRLMKRQAYPNPYSWIT